MNETEDLDIRDGAETLSGSGDSGDAGASPAPEQPDAPPPAEPERELAPPPPHGAFDAAIPWRGMPSLPSAQPLVAGVLQGARDADDTALPEAEGFTGQAGGPFAPQAEDEDGISVAAGLLPQAEADEYFESEALLAEQAADRPGFEAELVLGVKFSQYGPVYFFTAGQIEPKEAAPGKMVLVDTEQGVALAEVVTARRLRLPLPKIRTEEGLEVEIKPIKGLAGAADIAAAADNRILAAGARMFCKECIRERNLDMKLVEVEVLHDRSKIIFYFTAPTRIDFRELVKDLVRNYHTRIELRQIGVRHETQMIGALGNCGMTCCCRRYLRKFAPVTIKMAKEQNLFLNPAKLSGMCGRLLCCLAYEQENYDEFHKRSPKIGKKYKTDSGIVKVMRANLFRQSIFVLDEANVESEYQLEEWEALHPQRHDQPAQPAQPGQNAENGRRQEQKAEKPRRHDREERRQAPPAPEEDAPAGQAEAPETDDADESAPVHAEAGFPLPPEQEDDAAESDALPAEADEDEADDAPRSPHSPRPEEKSIFGLPGSRYASQAAPENPSGNRAPGQRPGSGSPQAGAGRKNNNHKHGNRHKPSKKGRTPGGGQG